MKKFLIVALAVMSCWTVSNAKVNVTTPESTAPDGVEAVDLGLSVKWANVNVGAKKPSDFGTYFAWGETKPKNFYSWDSYQWSRGKTQFLTKYSTADRKTQLDPSDDAARANWGDEWRTPTEAEYEELVNPDNCKWEWTTKDGVNGYKVTGKKTRHLLDVIPLHQQSQQGMVSGVQIRRHSRPLRQLRQQSLQRSLRTCRQIENL